MSGPLYIVSEGEPMPWGGRTVRLTIAPPAGQQLSRTVQRPAAPAPSVPTTSSTFGRESQEYPPRYKWVRAFWDVYRDGKPDTAWLPSRLMKRGWQVNIDGKIVSAPRGISPVFWEAA